MTDRWASARPGLRGLEPDLERLQAAEAKRARRAARWRAEGRPEVTP